MREQQKQYFRLVGTSLGSWQVSIRWSTLWVASSMRRIQLNGPARSTNTTHRPTRGSARTISPRHLQRRRLLSVKTETCTCLVTTAFVANAFTVRSPVLTARDYLRAALGGNGRIHAVGGTAGGCDGATAIVEEYKPATNVWLSRASMPTDRNVPAVVGANNGKHDIIGQDNSTGYQATVDVATLP